MNGKFLLDTNIIIRLFGGESVIQEKLLHADEIFIPCIALGELYFGANKSKKISDNIARIENFAAHSVIINCDIDTA